MHHPARTFALALLLPLLAACGGGGGSGGGASNSGGGTAANPLDYSGAETQAVLTPSNSARFLEAGFGANATAVTVSPASASPGAHAAQVLWRSLALRARAMAARTRAQAQADTRAHAASAGTAQPAANSTPIDETNNCAVRGTVRLAGSVDAAGLGTLTVTFANCDDGADGVALNGSMQFIIRAYFPNTQVLSDYRVTFTQLTLTAPGGSSDMQGRIDYLAATDVETYTINITSRDNTSLVLTDVRNLRDEFRTVFSGTGVQGMTEALSGRLYLSDVGYVVVRTVTPLLTSDRNFAFADSGGPIVLDGANASSLRFTVLSGSLVKIDIDRDGDAAFETQARVRWVDLGQPISSDLADSDGDGMNNSWETHYGLNPNDGSDASGDLDNDGTSNFVEYFGGTLPNSAASVPNGPAELTVALLPASAHTADTGDWTEYDILVTNHGPRAAQRATVQIASQGGASDIRTFNASPWSCGAGAAPAPSLACTLDTLANGAGATLRVRVNTGSTPGTVRYAVTLSADTLEVDTTDNVATAETTVRDLRVTDAQAVAFGTVAFSTTRNRFLVTPGRANVGFDGGVQFVDPVSLNVTGAIPNVVFGAVGNIMLTADETTLYGYHTESLGTHLLQIDMQTGNTLHDVIVGSPLTPFVEFGSHIRQQPGTNDVVLVEIADQASADLEAYAAGVRLPSRLLQHHGAVFNDTGEVLFAVHDLPGAVVDVVRASLDNNGLHAIDVLTSGIPAPVKAALRYDTGRLFVDGGHVLDAATGAELANLGKRGAFTIDRTNRRLIIAQENAGRLHVFDLDSLQWLYTAVFPYDCIAVEAVLNDGLLCIGSSTTQLLRLPFLAP